MNKSLVSLLAGLPALSVSATGAVLFADTFDRTNGRTIQESLSGITNNTGSVFNPGGDPNNSPAYLHGHVNPASSYAGGFNSPVDPGPTNGASARIVTTPTYTTSPGTPSVPITIPGTTLELASEAAGSSNAIINHNFVNASIIAAGGFSVTLDVFARGGSNAGQGGGFAVGMSLAEALSSGDANFSSASPLTGGFSSSIGAGNAVASGVVSDFWIVLRSSGDLVWGAGAGTTGIFSATVGPANPSGTITVDFSLDDFNAGSIVNYEIFYDDVSRGTGTFTWSGTEENYIGLDGRNSNGVNLDNLAIATIPEPSSVLLGLLGGAFLLRRRR